MSKTAPKITVFMNPLATAALCFCLSSSADTYIIKIDRNVRTHLMNGMRNKNTITTNRDNKRSVTCHTIANCEDFEKVSVCGWVGWGDKAIQG